MLQDRYYASSGEVLSLREGDAFLAYYPEETPRLTCGVDHLEEAPVIGKQWYSYAPLEDDHYRWVLGPARTYFTSMQVRRGLQLGGPPQPPGLGSSLPLPQLQPFACSCQANAMQLAQHRWCVMIDDACPGV